MHACRECRAEIVGLLVERGADVGLRVKAARTTSFLDHGQSALTIGSSCLIARRRAGLAPVRGMPESYVRMELGASEKIVSRLIPAGADVNGADADGQTPLMMAATQGSDGTVRRLIAAKASVNARDREGRLAIDYADPEVGMVAGLLREAGSAKATGRSGRTVCDAERALDRLGYNTPIIDCIGGQQLRVVVVRFQNDRKLEATGELDAPTRRALGIR